MHEVIPEPQEVSSTEQCYCGHTYLWRGYHNDTSNTIHCSTEFSESLAARDASSSKFPKIVENQKIQVCAANAFTEPLVHSLPS